MKKLLLYTVFFFCAVFGYAQTNIVPNFSFEQYDTCPNNEDQIQYATGWSKYSISTSTPDYYNACSPASSYGVPQSPNINQADHRNCGAYAGVLTWGAAGSEQEHVGIQLSQPMVVGQKYFLSFYTVMAELYVAGMYFGMPSNNIGLRLSTMPYDENTPIPLDNFAHLNSFAVISDSINWQRISGSIIANSAYQYVILGNFFDDANTLTSPYSCGSCFNTYSYYVYDDICVSTDSLLCNGGVDALPCAVSVPEINYDNKVRVFPNPAANEITLSFLSNEWEEINVTDVFGRNCYTERVNGSASVTLDISSLKSGMYFLNVISQNKIQIIKKKIIKL